MRIPSVLKSFTIGASMIACLGACNENENYDYKERVCVANLIGETNAQINKNAVPQKLIPEISVEPVKKSIEVEINQNKVSDELMACINLQKKSRIWYLEGCDEIEGDKVIGIVE